MGAGTGGTICGIGRWFKDVDPNVQVIGVDPDGSILAVPDSMNGPMKSYLVEGVGYDFIPRVLDWDVVDRWAKSNDTDSFYWTRRLIKEEGLLCGGSSGGVFKAGLDIARELGEGHRVVIILPDGIRNYMTKFLSDDWMYENGFITEAQLLDSYTPKLIPSWSWGKEFTVKDLTLNPPVTVSHNATVK